VDLAADGKTRSGAYGLPMNIIRRGTMTQILPITASVFPVQNSSNVVHDVAQV